VGPVAMVPMMERYGLRPHPRPRRKTATCGHASSPHWGIASHRVPVDCTTDGANRNDVGRLERMSSVGGGVGGATPRTATRAELPIATLVRWLTAA
jgi:hypothetical protein